MDSKTDLTWDSIAIAFSFIAFDALISYFFRLEIGGSLVVASIRCVVQLGLVGLILQSVFETKNIWFVAGIACLLNLIGAFEVVVNRSPRRYSHMFPAILVAMTVSTIPISILATTFIMSVKPFWKPDEYIPIVGMLAGATISSIVIAVNAITRELQENRDKVETYLAFGGSRLEVIVPIARQALQLALTPPINQMSVLGIIAIPGMMTGAILGGSSVQQAAKLQIVIMFCISASTALASIIAAASCLTIVVDRQHRIRTDRLDTRKHVVWRACDSFVQSIASLLTRFRDRIQNRSRPPCRSEERQGLLETSVPHE